MKHPVAGLRWPRLLSRLMAVTCGCASPRWAAEFSRTVAGITVRAEARSR